MPRVLTLLLLAAGLSGCASYAWLNADGKANYDRDHYACQQEGLKAFPAMVREQTVQPARYMPPGWDCPPGITDRAQCSWRAGRWLPPETRVSDVNERSRRELTDSCLRARGWVYQRID